MIARAFLVLVCLVSLAACASLGVKTEGVSGPVAWHATDLELASKTFNNQGYWVYSFSVLLEEKQGTGLVFNEIQTTVYQPGAGSGTATYNGVWRLEANGRMRIPLESTLVCHFSAGGACGGSNVPIPMWRLILRGRSDQNHTVTIPIDMTLPADPPATPVVTSKSVPAIELAKPAAPAGKR